MRRWKITPRLTPEEESRLKKLAASIVINRIGIALQDGSLERRVIDQMRESDVARHFDDIRDGDSFGFVYTVRLDHVDLRMLVSRILLDRRHLTRLTPPRLGTDRDI